MSYLFEITHRRSNYQLDDLFTEFISANSVSEAREKVESLYPFKEGYSCRFIKKQEI